MQEFRYTELRAEGERQLSGVAVKYGDIAVLPFGKERFEVRAFGDLGAADVILNTMHDRRRPLARSGAGLTLTDGPEALEVRAQLPNTREADDVLQLVETRVYRGLSIEFAATRERMVGGVRSIQAARLTGIAICDRPAYPASAVEARGENLIRVLEGALPDEGDDARPAQIEAMAGAAGIDPATVEQILSGSINAPPRRRLEGFASALDGVSLDQLIEATIADGGDVALYRTQDRRRVWL